MKRLLGKIAVVTGANSGMGFATAIFLATDDAVRDISGEYFYKRMIARSSRRSKDMKLAKRLWKFTEELIELRS